MYGISTYNAPYSAVINNVIYGDTLSSQYDNGGNALQVTTGDVFGNIIYNFPYKAISATNTTAVANNLCFNNGTNCEPVNGNLNADPKFVDLVDFQLASDSPAVNAGPPDFTFADLDRTRNDMGAHGGPWNITQYDAQRNPNNLAPYVYPLFKASSSFSGGNLDIHALGVARLR
jgi:hypothetical protein